MKSKKNLWLATILIAIITHTFSYAQNYVNLALNSEVDHVQPMTGIVFWAENTSDLNSLGDKVQLEYSYLIYSDVVEEEGIYDWEVVDNLLSTAASRGRQVILRFRYTYPGETTPSVPAYIRNRSDYTDQYENVEGSNTYIPDWSNSTLENFTLEFFTKFADRYDNDPRLAFVQVGFGSYSEYHLFEGSLRLGVTFPTKEYQTTFLQHADSIFNETQWAISIDAANSQSTPISSSNTLLNLGYGLFDDSFLHESHSTSESEYNRESWLTFGANRADSKVAGGELNYFSTRDQQTVLNVEGPYGFTFEEMAEMYDITYMIGNDQLNYQSTSRIEDASLSTGYHFEITEFKTNGVSTLVTVKNTGIAPIYYDAYLTANNTQATTSLKGLLANQSKTFTINTVAADQGLSITSDRLVSGQEIQFDANIQSGGTVIPQPITPSLTLSDIDTFTFEEESQTVTINSNIDWIISEDSSWISLNKTSGANDGSFTITTNENTSTNDRFAIITVNGADISRSITVSQNGVKNIVVTPEPAIANLALNGTASQSTTSYGGNASRAIDGNVNGAWSGASVTHTTAITGSWWQVELSSPTNIGDIIIYNRTDSCCTERLSNFTITIYNSNNNEVFSQIITETPTPNITINANGILGNRIRIVNNLTNMPLSLAEVEIYAGEEDSSPLCSQGSNLALNGVIVDFSDEQNSTNVTDNIINDNTEDRWSALGFPQYATVDLGAEYNVNEINLDTFLNRDYQFIVDGSTTSFNSGFFTLVDASNNTDNGPITKTFTTQKVRYVRLTITGANTYTGSWSSISKFEINCAGNLTNKNIIEQQDDLFDITAFPNPCIESITISSNNNNQEIGSLQLTDIMGRLIIEETVNANNFTINNLNNITDGIYLLRVFNTEKETIKTIKVIKE